MRCAVRSFIGLAMLVAASLGGIEFATQNMPSLAPGGEQQMQATLIEPKLAASQALPLPPVPAPTFGGVVQTVAANEPAPLPPVTVAPQAPRATPIDPIVTPLKQTPSKSSVTKTPVVKSPVTGKTAKSAAPKSAVAKSTANKSAASKTLVTRPAPNKPAAAKVKSAKTRDAKSGTAAKAPINETGVTVIRPGFKLTCTATQKLDPVKQRCVPLKTASAKKTKG